MPALELFFESAPWEKTVGTLFPEHLDRESSTLVPSIELGRALDPTYLMGTQIRVDHARVVRLVKCETPWFFNPSQERYPGMCSALSKTGRKKVTECRAQVSQAPLLSQLLRVQVSEIPQIIGYPTNQER